MNAFQIGWLIILLIAAGGNLAGITYFVISATKGRNPLEFIKHRWVWWSMGALIMLGSLNNTVTWILKLIS